MHHSQVDTPDGISWHVETVRGTSSDRADTSTTQQNNVVLIPSGEGVCTTLGPLMLQLSKVFSPSYTITTFDYAGYGRSHAPKEYYSAENSVFTPKRLTSRVVTLLDTLQISRAIFVGTSSGGGLVLNLLATHPDRVAAAIIHEVPFDTVPQINALKDLPDAGIIEACRPVFANVMIEEQNDGRKKWAELGPEHHRLLEAGTEEHGGYVTWVRCLVGPWELEYTALLQDEKWLEQIRANKTRLFWTVGALRKEFWSTDFEVGEKLGVKVDGEKFVCSHFPQVTMTKEWADWIIECSLAASRTARI